MTPPPILTVEMLRLAQGCARRPWLDQRAAPPAQDDARWSRGLGLTQAALDHRARVIEGAAFESPLDLASGPAILRGMIPRLERALDPEAPEDAPLYRPVVRSLNNRPTPADHLQMDAFLWLLRQTQPEPVAGVLALPRERLRAWLDEDRLFSALESLVLLLDPTREPPVYLARRCHDCPWLPDCRLQPAITCDADLLHYPHKDALPSLRAGGITTLEQVVDLDPADLRRFRGIKASAEGVHAAARAWVERRAIWYGPLPQVCRAEGFHFDIETVPYTDSVWSIGWAHGLGPVEIAVVAPGQPPGRLALPDSAVLHLVPDPDSAWAALAEAVESTAGPVFHWTGFDAGVMHKTAPLAVRDTLGSRLHDLHASFKGAVRLPTDGNSLKSVAAYLGFGWAVYARWDLAFGDYQTWLDSGDEAALARASAYQRDDVLALARVWDWLRAEAP